MVNVFFSLVYVLFFVRIETVWFLQDCVILGVPQNTAFIDVSALTKITYFVSGRMFVFRKKEKIVLIFIFTIPVGVSHTLKVLTACQDAKRGALATRGYMNKRIKASSGPRCSCYLT